MAKRSTFPTCLDEIPAITLTWLRQMGHLKPHCRTSGSLSWSRFGKPSGSVSVVADTDNRFIELSYTSNEKSISYRIDLESIPSNLGKGEVWYFICPATGKRCRTLYECGHYFYSRFAFDKPMYSSQTEPKSTRGWLHAMRTLTLRDEFLAKRHSRTHYKGKITRRYQRILDRENRYDPNRIRRVLDRLKPTQIS